MFAIGQSGLHGGVDYKALQRPKDFAAGLATSKKARSLTIIATAPTTRSKRLRRDAVLFEEFKGTATGIFLDDKMVDKRRLPASTFNGSHAQRGIAYTKEDRARHWVLRKGVEPALRGGSAELLIDKLGTAPVANRRPSSPNEIHLAARISRHKLDHP